jgi:hypothetical protein
MWEMVAVRHGEIVAVVDKVGGLVVSRARLDTMGKGVILPPPEINPRCLSPRIH